MEWLKKSEINPEKTQRIIVCSNKNGKIHVLHWDYEDWILSETDDDFPGESVDFDFWMPVPNQPERSKREDFGFYGTPIIDQLFDDHGNIIQGCGALNNQVTD